MGAAHQDGIRAIAGPDLLEFCTPVPLRGENMTTVAEFTVQAGERVPFVMQWRPSHEPAAVEAKATRDRSSHDTERFWRTWSGRCTYDGPYRDRWSAR